jgi:hypothetical protein
MEARGDGPGTPAPQTGCGTRRLVRAERPLTGSRGSPPSLTSSATVESVFPLAMAPALHTVPVPTLEADFAAIQRAGVGLVSPRPPRPWPPRLRP